MAVPGFATGAFWNRPSTDRETDSTPTLTRGCTGLAAAYGFALANKRVAFQAIYVFLGLNGLRIAASEEAVVSLMISVASGDLEEEGLTPWLEANAVPRS